jgi:hypothetical protein
MERPALQDLLTDIPASIDIVVEWRTPRHCSIAAQRPKNPRKLQGFGSPQCRRAEFQSDH